MLMDVTQIEGEYEEKKIYSFLSLTWAIVADIDINSECLRCCGNARFTLWGIWRVLCMKRYLGDFSFNGFHIKNKADFDLKQQREKVDI
jgi:hypothetical protein